MKNKIDLKLTGIILLGVVALSLLFTFFVNGYQNKAINLEEKINAGTSDIKIQEKRRVDLLFNLVDVVEEYSEYEANTFKDIVYARSSAGSVDMKEATTAINALTEAYPELKSNENYKQLMNELSITENMMAQYRENYTKQVESYNRYVRSFPARIFLSWTGYEKIQYEYLDYNTSADAPQNLFNR